MGARHFLDLLVDGDMANNQLNWQWMAGTGTDTRPNRVLNPIAQGKRYDPDGAYVRRWVEELADVKAADVHEPWNLPAQERASTGYPEPVVSLAEGLDRFKRARGAPEVRREDIRRAAGHHAQHLVRVRHTPHRTEGAFPMPTPHWIFGDLLGPHFLTPAGEDGPDRGAPVVMIEARSVFRRRRFHRAKAHLVLSAMRHRAAELGVRMTYVRAETYRKGLRRAVGGAPVTVCHPTSYAALRLVRALPRVRVLPARGFLVVREEFAGWAEGRGGRRLLREDFYRWVRPRSTTC